MSAPEVQIPAGTLRGRGLPDGCAAFLGVPYAAPPVGALRYAEPQEAAAWDGTRDATAFGPPAPQPERTLAGLDTRSFMGPRWTGEDPQLTLNVWTPAADGPHPVMVWMHGGAFVAGSPAAPCYDGAAFARDGIVLVTVTYRLGAEGFLALDGGVTNAGIRDQLAALQWVQREIAAFGGDTGNVTAFGQSAGAMTLGALLASPVSRGLVHRAALQSGGQNVILSAEQGARVAAAVAGHLGVEPTADAFRAVPIADVIAAQAKVLPGTVDLQTDSDADPAFGMLQLLPVRDGDVVPHDPLAAVSGRAGSDVPLLIGDTTEEGNLYVAGSPDVDLAHAVPLTRSLFRDPIAALADAHRASGAPTFVYEFAWPSGALGGRLGAAHAVELPFVFDTLDAPGLRGDAALLGDAGGPPELAARMHGAWVAFARGGDPGWPADAAEVFA
ncbi:Carboxylesterase [Paraconexibacter sp. AEG42_29]|uniref:Carboxylesterase n=1 Tax=Paraconexibacter sp. AEG42_29 TaxID=2997339 RepID=A0AAU7B373_9ACTN